MAKIRILVFFMFSVLTTAMYSQHYCVIQGRVLDENQRSLPGALIKLQNINKGAISDQNGYYSISGVPEGFYELDIAYIGYIKEHQQIRVASEDKQPLNFVLKPGLELSEVVVSGQLQGQSKALNVQKNKKNITNIISSDQVGRFPDANIGDALKRIPGINVQYDQGEARFGNIRGTAPQYNSVMVNGERIPSAEAEERSVQLDLMPADMIQALEINKAITPDMDADAIGGSVNLITRSAPYDKRLSFTLGSGYNILANKPIYSGSIVAANRFLQKKIGVIASASYNNNQLGSDNIEAEWDYTDENQKNASAFTEEFQVRQYYLQRIRKSVSIGLDYSLHPHHTIFVNGIYNHRNDWENRYRNVYKDIEFNDANESWSGVLEKETKGGNKDTKSSRLEDQRMMNLAISGEHLIGSVKFDWTASYSKASEERPNERYIVYSVEDVQLDPDFSNPSKPSIRVISPTTAGDYSSDYTFNELTEEFQYTEDVDKNAKWNIHIPMQSNRFQNSLQIGYRYRGKEKMRNNTLNSYEAIDSDVFDANTLTNTKDLSKNNFLAGNYQTGHHVSREYLSSLNLQDSKSFEKEVETEAEAGNYNAREYIHAAYLMLNQQLGSNISFVAGVRIEHTNQEYQGNQYNADEKINTRSKIESDHYLNILPGLHVRYEINNSTLIKAAWTHSLARPNYYALVPYKEISQEDNELSIGNPELTPTKSMNMDVMLEKYYNNIGMISAGLFYKDIKDFIVPENHEDFEYDGHVWDTYSQPINGGNAKLLGLEVALQRQLDFLPGFLKDFGIYANYTYTHSQVHDLRIEGRESEETTLPGTADHTLNASLSYEKKRFSVRASANYASAFVEEFGDEAFYDRYYDKTLFLDINASYAVSPMLSLFADATNLLNQPLSYYQGTKRRMMQSEYYNTKLQFGVKIEL